MLMDLQVLGFLVLVLAGTMEVPNLWGQMGDRGGRNTEVFPLLPLLMLRLAQVHKWARVLK
ncbi:hypothetical protein SM19410_03910 [Xanthomonas hortorum pv. gardneri]|nr:hypothetical protein SM17710_08980 [Xanthomonas hortorum pv. gardneri]KLB01095.1 hypothetical protein SM19410_03910 [Xanthomonas hortorum pv. gardneri]KLB04095.1 hypothetical protein SM18210_08745 [Xanthomonas hortorum pv. gardneri]KLB09909.1 hypothetical protein SM23410_10735 [Xanthomonas hortorum pv. gardneri]KLB10151.1 hypothetical protein SM22010_12370 [Xanthomonas hortorum pv. gardneri]